MREALETMKKNPWIISFEFIHLHCVIIAVICRRIQDKFKTTVETNWDRAQFGDEKIRITETLPEWQKINVPVEQSLKTIIIVIYIIINFIVLFTIIFYLNIFSTEIIY